MGVEQVVLELLARGGMAYRGHGRSKRLSSPTRYIQMPNGRIVRVSDHRANQKTKKWMKAVNAVDLNVSVSWWRQELKHELGVSL
jgi:hypothetical protein